MNPNYDAMKFRRCGNSGLKLPEISLGGWHNFNDLERARELTCAAFEAGVTYFDFANNYGPPAGLAEVQFGNILNSDLAAHRDEIVLATKAGYMMWDGPYGNGGSRKYLLSSLDQSLNRLGVDYVDIFYHHRPDPETPLEESLGALVTAVQSGKALYAGISNYPADLVKQAAKWMESAGVPLLLNQSPYNMLNREVEDAVLHQLNKRGMGMAAYSPLAQGILSNRYLQGIPQGSRAASDSPFLQARQLNAHRVDQIRSLHEVAEGRGQSLAQLALQWCLKDQRVTTVIIGASRIEQVEDCLRAVAAPALEKLELDQIDQILGLSISTPTKEEGGVDE
jgi:L-glyceraldehyde 3-phosphate reductase